LNHYFPFFYFLPPHRHAHRWKARTPPRTPLTTAPLHELSVGSRCGWARRTLRCTWSSTAGGPRWCTGSTRPSRRPRSRRTTRRCQCTATSTEAPTQCHDHLFLRVVPQRGEGGDHRPLRPRRQRR
jgi:hypothetical protein